jgi:hypothetical protein
MTNREKREITSTKLRTARETVAPLLEQRVEVPSGKTHTWCQECFEQVYVLKGGVRVDLDGQPHKCPRDVKHDTERPGA